MIDRPKILVLAPDEPFPVRAGGQMRMASLIPAMAECAAVHFVCMGPQLEEATAAWARGLGITIEALPPRRKGRLRENLDRLKTILSLSNLRFRREDKRRLDDVFRRLGPDLVWLETPYLVRYVLDWVRSVPVAVDYWGTSEGAQRIYRISKGWRRLQAWVRWKLARRGEKRYAPQLSAIVCVSEPDADYFRRIAPACPVSAIPIAVVGACQSRTPARHEASAFRMIFTGDMSYRPNVDAAVYFTKEIFPAIRSAVPAVRVVFAGRNPLPEVNALSEVAGVGVTGAVPALSDVIAKADLYVLPMRLGSGFRSKLCEVFPLEVPIVTTSVGAEGLALVHNENCLIADSAVEFARACIRLLGSHEEREQLGRNAGRLAAETYSQDTVRRQVRGLLRGLVHGQGPGAPVAESAPHSLPAVRHAHPSHQQRA